MSEGLGGRYWVGLARDWGIALGIAVAIFVAWAVFVGGSSVVSEGEAPDFTLTSIQGDPVQLKALRGEPVVLNFWATWCGPCKEELPELIAWTDANDDVSLYGISVDRGMHPDRLARFVHDKKLNYPILHDSSGSVADAWGIDTLPTTVVITADGHVGGHHVGKISRRGLDRLLERAAAHTH